MGWGWQVLGKPLPLPLREQNLPGRPEKEQKWGGSGGNRISRQTWCSAKGRRVPTCLGQSGERGGGGKGAYLLVHLDVQAIGHLVVLCRGRQKWGRVKDVELQRQKTQGK